MLKELFVKGPYTVGIFRKSANARVGKELRAKLETDPNIDMTEVPVIVIASVFKVRIGYLCSQSIGKSFILFMHYS